MKQRTKTIREKRGKVLMKKDFLKKKEHIDYLRQGFLLFGALNLKPNNEEGD